MNRNLSAIAERIDIDPMVAHEVVLAAAKVMMAAKCIRPSLGDTFFFRECEELIVLSLLNLDVKPFFEEVSRSDLNAYKSDRLIDPSMLALTRERIAEVIRRLR